MRFLLKQASNIAAERERLGRALLVVFMDEGRFGRISNLGGNV